MMYTKLVTSLDTFSDFVHSRTGLFFNKDLMAIVGIYLLGFVYSPNTGDVWLGEAAELGEEIIITAHPNRP